MDDTYEIDEEYIDELMSGLPIKGVFYTVGICYNKKYAKKFGIPKDLIETESDPVASWKEAMELAKSIAEKVKKGHKKAKMIQLSPGDAPDEYLFYVIQKKDWIVKTGIVAEDYRGETIH